MVRGVIPANPAAAIETVTFDVKLNNDYKPTISGYERMTGIVPPDSGGEIAQGAFTVKDMVEANTVGAYFEIIDPSDLPIIYGILDSYLKYVEVVKTEYNLDDELTAFIEECKAFMLTLKPMTRLWMEHMESTLAKPVTLHSLTEDN